MRAVAVCWILVVGAGWLDSQVVLTRRDYAEHGRTFPQIWMADAGTVNFRRLTHSARAHSEPLCSSDGKLIYFTSDGDAERSLNSYGGAYEPEVWAYDRQTRQERFLWPTSREHGLDLNGMTANGGLLVRVGTELHSLLRNLWIIDNVDEAAVSPDGRRVALVIAESYDKQGQSQNAKLFVADAVTGQSQIELGHYSKPAWSPDGRSLLVGLYGENGGAGDPQNDYFLLNLATSTWTPELTARRLLWLQAETVLYLRPYGTTPLVAGPHSVWTSQLATYDLASHRDMALTSGLQLNDDLSTCAH